MREVRASQEHVYAVSEQLERLNRTLVNLEDSQEQMSRKIEILKENTVAATHAEQLRRDRSKNRYDEAADTSDDLIKRIKHNLRTSQTLLDAHFSMSNK